MKRKLAAGSGKVKKTPAGVGKALLGAARKALATKVLPAKKAVVKPSSPKPPIKVAHPALEKKKAERMPNKQFNNPKPQTQKKGPGRGRAPKNADRDQEKSKAVLARRSSGMAISSVNELERDAHAKKRALTAIAASRANAGLTATSSSSAQETICREVACESLASNLGYCRLHYVKNWKRIKRKDTILREGKLNQFIEELIAKYPDKYIEAIRLDLADNKLFNKVIQDLELTESLEESEDQDEDSLDGIVDSIRRDVEVEDDADVF